MITSSQQEVIPDPMHARSFAHVGWYGVIRSCAIKSALIFIKGAVLHYNTCELHAEFTLVCWPMKCELVGLPRIPIHPIKMLAAPLYQLNINWFVSSCFKALSKLNSNTRKKLISFWPYDVYQWLFSCNKQYNNWKSLLILYYIVEKRQLVVLAKAFVSDDTIDDIAYIKPKYKCDRKCF